MAEWAIASWFGMANPPFDNPPVINRVGNATIQKIWETDLNGMTFRQLFPGFEDRARVEHPDWFPDGTADAEGHALMSVHSWLVRHDGRTILIDAGAGNDKPRPQQKVLDHLATPFLDRLRFAGVAPEEVDTVLVTHIHSDHVGWATRLQNGRWLPTFPNAQIVVSNLEYVYGQALTEDDAVGVDAARAQAALGEPVRTPVSGTFDDSIRPLDPAKLRRIAIDGAEVLPGIRFMPTAGHSIDHASIELTSHGEVALFPGDVFHHPVEVYDPGLVSVFCEFPDASRAARAWLLDHAATSNAWIFSSHFPGTSAGRIVRADGRYAWRAL